MKPKWAAPTSFKVIASVRGAVNGLTAEVIEDWGNSVIRAGDGGGMLEALKAKLATARGPVSAAAAADR